jgi:hypothetical protein
MTETPVALQFQRLAVDCHIVACLALRSMAEQILRASKDNLSHSEKHSTAVCSSACAEFRVHWGLIFSYRFKYKKGYLRVLGHKFCLKKLGVTV